MAPAIERTMGSRPFLRDARERLAALDFEHFAVVPQSPTIGAEVRGLSLAEPLQGDVLKELRTALVEFKVLFFCDQDIDVLGQPLDPALRGQRLLAVEARHGARDHHRRPAPLTRPFTTPSATRSDSRS